MAKEDIIEAMREHLTALQELAFEAEDIFDWDENMLLIQVSEGIHRARVAVTKIKRHQAEQ